MSSSLHLDHLVIIVDDLQAAMSDYRALGFTVQFGGEHADGLSHNALISFQDGTYLELYALKQRSQIRMIRWLRALGLLSLHARNRSPIARRFFHSVALGEGLGDYALGTDDLDAMVAACRQQGIAVDGPTPGGRVRPDGVQLEWRLAIPESRELPFFIEDVTPRELRVPQHESQDHPNGARGINTLICGVAPLSGAPMSPQGVLAESAGSETPNQVISAFNLAGRTAFYRLGEASFVLAEPGDRSNPLGWHMVRRGPGPYALLLDTNNPSAVGELDRTKTHGVRMIPVQPG